MVFWIMTHMHAATGFCSLLPDQSTYIKHSTTFLISH